MTCVTVFLQVLFLWELISEFVTDKSYYCISSVTVFLQVIVMQEITLAFITNRSYYCMSCVSVFLQIILNGNLFWHLSQICLPTEWAVSMCVFRSHSGINSVYHNLQLYNFPSICSFLTFKNHFPNICLRRKSASKHVSGVDPNSLMVRL